MTHTHDNWHDNDDYSNTYYGGGVVLFLLFVLIIAVTCCLMLPPLSDYQYPSWGQRPWATPQYTYERDERRSTPPSDITHIEIGGKRYELKLVS